ncbi:protein-s-isoprenylcysteine o-methyltransferase [Anaeramoeba ignava]|uniref:Protein-S-isoprenylcysteine O-methyltransferase n=1 Tax=Anaeramoeba ignava TaxID=1746090 RepID=A0A9Q0LWY0_ANAIG|nr:protein-s-isoprenylcysteine o-methyltransferase [Anaeramoeba ignava]
MEILTTLLISFIFFFSFHFGEFIITAIYNRKLLNWKSTLITGDYSIGVLFTYIEYFISFYFFPQFKMKNSIQLFGLLLIIIGDFIRKSAMITAKNSFTHEIETYYREDHILITFGIYKYIRHPGYLGFFIWSIGIELFFCNFIMLNLALIILWIFFKKRIKEEEEILIYFFGDDYREYRSQTPTWIPGIK